MNEYEKTLKEITERYAKHLDDNEGTKFKYIWNNVRFHSIFALRIQETMLKEKIEQLTNLIKNSKANDTLKNKKDIRDILNEYSGMKNDAEKSFKYYDDMLYKLLIDYEKNIDKKDIGNTYNYICKSIIQSRFKYYINAEKKLLILLDKIYKLSFFN